MRIFDYGTIREELFTPDIMNLLSAIHELKGKQELFSAVTPDVLKILQQHTKIQSVGASNRIEGIFAADERLVKLVKGKAKPSNRSEQEIVGYRDVLSTIHENYEHLVPDSKVISQLHRDLYAYTLPSMRGRPKGADKGSEVASSDRRRIRFQPLSDYANPEAIENLCHTFLQALDEGKIDPLVLIAMFNLDFLCLRPFTDGNGRMSRLLTLLLLCREGHIVGKFTSFDLFLERTVETYYDAKTQSSRGWHERQNSYVPFVKYYLAILLHVYMTFEKKVESIRPRGVKPTEQIRQIFADRPDQITKAELCALCPDINLTIIERTLAALIKEGYILKTGYGRTATYIRSEE